MPTNPLWLEHTEKAAWDTVQALRQQIETERARVEQLVRLQGNLPKLHAALGSLKVEHALAGDEPIDILESAARQLAALTNERDSLKADAEEQARQRASRVASPRSTELADAGAPLVDCSAAGSASGFLRQLQEHARRRAHKPARSHERLLDALEDELERLEQASPGDIREHALELARLAWQLADSRP
jgi:hypothetical protein